MEAVQTVSRRARSRRVSASPARNCASWMACRNTRQPGGSRSFAPIQGARPLLVRAGSPAVGSPARLSRPELQDQRNAIHIHVRTGEVSVEGDILLVHRCLSTVFDVTCARTTNSHAPHTLVRSGPRASADAAGRAASKPARSHRRHQQDACKSERVCDDALLAVSLREIRRSATHGPNPIPQAQRNACAARDVAPASTPTFIVSAATPSSPPPVSCASVVLHATRPIAALLRHRVRGFRPFPPS